MNKIAKYFRQREIETAEKRFNRFRGLYRDQGWNQMTLEELNNIPATPNSKAQDAMETAAWMMRLANAYWALYSKHYKSEGRRGQDLDLKCWELLYDNLGLSTITTMSSLENICRWDIGSAERAEIVRRVLSSPEKAIPQTKIPPFVQSLEQVILCCLRNHDYSDSVKALVQFYRVCNERRNEKSDWNWSWATLVFAVYLGRQEWDEAQSLLTKYSTSVTSPASIWVCAEGERYSCEGELQMKRGQLEDGEATLQKGIRADQADNSGYFLCYEQLLQLYLQQKRWNDAERLSRDLIGAKEDWLPKVELQDPSGKWYAATRRATQVVKMNRWRIPCLGVKYIEFWDEDARVYFLHQLYSNKRQLAVAYLNLTRYDDAQQQLEELMENRMHEENPILIASKELLVTIYIDLGKLEEAEKRQEEIVEAKSKSLGYDSVELIPALEKLADIYQKNNHLGKRHHVKLRLLRYR